MNDYKKYSLSQLENWVYDALSAAEATPQEIYDVIKGVVEETYYHHKHHASISYELLSLLNSGVDNNKYQNYLNKVLSCDKDDPSPECKGAWNDFWENKTSQDEYKGSTVSSVQHIEEEQCREYNLREAEYYDKRAKLDMNYQEAVAAGWTMTDDGFWTPPEKKDKVMKWQLPVEMDPSGEYYVLFPDDLLEAANLTEGDKIEWDDNGDGSYTLRKIAEPISMDEC